MFMTASSAIMLVAVWIAMAGTMPAFAIPRFMHFG